MPFRVRMGVPQMEAYWNDLLGSGAYQRIKLSALPLRKPKSEKPKGRK
jgi:ABC-type uncharacterized transport system fused permease/ATPase subunit